MSAWSRRGVCLVGGASAWSGGVSAWSGGSAWSGRGGLASQHALRQTPPPLWTESQTPVKTLPWPNFVAAGKNKVPPQYYVELCKLINYTGSHLQRVKDTKETASYKWVLIVTELFNIVVKDCDEKRSARFNRTRRKWDPVYINEKLIILIC